MSDEKHELKRAEMAELVKKLHADMSGVTHYAETVVVEAYSSKANRGFAQEMAVVLGELLRIDKRLHNIIDTLVEGECSQLME